MRVTPTTFFALSAALLSVASAAHAQVPVDEDGNAIVYDAVAERDIGLTDGQGLSNAELEALVDRVALYPDDLLAIVLPAASYPLQVVEAGRFLDALDDDASREPDADWDDSIVALINYPEIVELMNEDLEWTYALGEAFITQQQELLTAVDSFRDRAYAAGNLRSDDYQEVRESDDGVIEIEPVNDDVIYVPYYEPERVVVYQTRPVYHYYSRPYPVYYYPYADSWRYDGYFYGLTSAFRIGWSSHSLHVLHHSHRYHPYYGRYYRDYWRYRRPSIHVHNSIYVGSNGRRSYRYGDYWRPRHERRIRLDGQRVTRSRYYGDRQRESIRVRQDTRRDSSRGIVDRRSVDGRVNNRRVQSTARSQDTAGQRRSSTVRSNDRRQSEQRRTNRPVISADRRARISSDGVQRDTRQRNSGSAQNVQQRRSDRQLPVRSERQQRVQRPTSSQSSQAQRPTVRRPTQAQSQPRSIRREAPSVRRSESRPSPSRSQSRPSVERSESRPSSQRRSESRTPQRQSENRASSRRSERRSDNPRRRSQD